MTEDIDNNTLASTLGKHVSTVHTVYDLLRCMYVIR